MNELNVKFEILSTDDSGKFYISIFVDKELIRKNIQLDCKTLEEAQEMTRLLVLKYKTNTIDEFLKLK